MRVIHVDDDDDLRLIVSVSLGQRHEVVGYPSVDEAIAEGDWPKTDAAIIDVMMPRRSGDELLEWVAANHPHVKRVMCTALGTKIDINRFALAHDIVTKPFTADDLEKALA